MAVDQIFELFQLLLLAVELFKHTSLSLLIHVENEQDNYHRNLK